MGQNLTGIVFFGFKLPSLKVSEEDLNEEWAEEFRPPQPEDKSDYKAPEWDEWRFKLKEWESTPQFVEIDWCGVENAETYFVNCPCFRQTSRCGIIEMSDLTVTAEAQKWLDAFCDKFNLPKKTAGWYLGCRLF